MRIGNLVIVLGIALMIFYSLFPGYYSASNPGTLFRGEQGRLNFVLFLYVLLMAVTVILIIAGVKLRQMETMDTSGPDGPVCQRQVCGIKSRPLGSMRLLGLVRVGQPPLRMPSVMA